MPAKSEKQQKFFGMVHGLQKGTTEPSDVSAEVEKVAKDISADDAEDFAATKHTGLPDKVDESDGYIETPEELKVKKDAVQSGMPKTREKKMKKKIHEKHIKLRDLIEESWMEEDLSHEDKTGFLEAVRNYNTYGKQIYREGNLIELAEKLAKICKMAEHFTIRESDNWFDDVTVKRNMGELKKLGGNFHKVATEVQAVQDRMTGLYEDMGNILGRYFEVQDLKEIELMNQKKAAIQQRLAETDSISVGDRVEVDFEKLQQHTNVRPYLKLVSKMVDRGRGSAEVVKVEGDKIYLAVSKMDAMLGTAEVPVSVLKKVAKKEAINEKDKRG